MPDSTDKPTPQPSNLPPNVMAARITARGIPPNVGASLGQFISTVPAAIGVRMIYTDLLATLVCSIEDRHWEEMVESARTPCGTHGCDCYVKCSEFFEHLDARREEAMALLRKAAERNGTTGNDIQFEG